MAWDPTRSCTTRSSSRNFSSAMVGAGSRESFCYRSASHRFPSVGKADPAPRQSAARDSRSLWKGGRTHARDEGRYLPAPSNRVPEHTELCV